MKTKREIVRIKEIYKIEGFKIYCLFNNEEHRYIDFEKLFQTWNIKKGDIEYLLLNVQELQKVKLSNGTLSWNNIKTKLLNEHSEEIEYPYEVDPVVLYENSLFDQEKLVDNLGILIRNERKKAGLTKKQLATKSGIAVDYISKLENTKANIELLIYRDILKNGFGKNLKINID